MAKALRLELVTGVGRASAIATAWFTEVAPEVPRSQYEKRGGLADDASGAVYAFFGNRGQALYVGQTSRRIKLRQHDQNHAHRDQPWWSRWRVIRFVQMEDETDRLTLELLLVLGLSPKHNRKPRHRNPSEMFEVA